MNDGHFSYITNSLKETLGTTCQGCVQHGQSELIDTNAPVGRSVHWTGCGFSFGYVSVKDNKEGTKVDVILMRVGK